MPDSGLDYSTGAIGARRLCHIQDAPAQRTARQIGIIYRVSFGVFVIFVFLRTQLTFRNRIVNTARESVVS